MNSGRCQSYNYRVTQNKRVEDTDQYQSTMGTKSVLNTTAVCYIMAFFVHFKNVIHLGPVCKEFNWDGYVLRFL